jgi:hypothetical protein
VTDPAVMKAPNWRRNPKIANGVKMDGSVTDGMKRQDHSYNTPFAGGFAVRRHGGNFEEDEDGALLSIVH